MKNDRDRVVEQARGLLARPDWVILDTETTGLSRVDEIVQIGILSPEGAILMDALVRPTQPITLEAAAVHGITNEDVREAPAFPAVYEELIMLIEGKILVIYNADFDLRLLNQTLEKYRLPPLDMKRERVVCAMRMYSAWRGEMWGDGSYKWQKLIGGDHTAIGDCKATLELIKKMARE